MMCAGLTIRFPCFGPYTSFPMTESIELGLAKVLHSQSVSQSVSVSHSQFHVVLSVSLNILPSIFHTFTQHSHEKGLITVRDGLPSDRSQYRVKAIIYD